MQRRLVGVLFAMALGCGAAIGQEGERPKPEPVQPTGVRPAAKDPVIPGLDEPALTTGASRLRAEGTFLVERRGSVLKLPTGERAMVFFADAEGQKERPMVLVPCQRLQQMEQMGADERTAFVVTGQVFVYSGVNYFLPTLARQAGGTAEPREAAPAAGGRAERDPAVQDLIHQLEAQREQPRESPAATVRADTAEVQALPEGQAIVRRRGRLVRLLGGEWAIAFDSGPAGDPKSDRPMAVSPCLNLQRMEAWAMRNGDSTSFEVSGRVLTYQGKNWVIPTMFQVLPKAELEARH